MVDKRFTTGRGDGKLGGLSDPSVQEAVKPRLLVIETDPAVLPIVERCAWQLGFDVQSRGNGRQALGELASLRPQVALVDLHIAELSGIDVLKAVRRCEVDCDVILMTEHVSTDEAIQAVKAGAFDCLSKPLDVDRLRERLLAIKEEIAQRERLLRVDAEIALQIEFQGMIGRSAVMRELFQSIRRLAPHGRVVLVTGERGTGKELVARAFHDSGPRRVKPLVTVDCSTADEMLLGSELFGHVRGAFAGATDTRVGIFEQAHDGTLFLDDVGELPLRLQDPLLHAIEHREIQRLGSPEARTVDVHVLAATTHDMRADVAADRFRSELLRRLSTIEIHVPALRERREDIPYLTAAFVDAASQRLGRPIACVASGAERRLREAPWPGNVRELREVIEQACSLGDGATLSERDVETAMAAAGVNSRETSPGKDRVIAGGARASAVPDLLTTAQRDQIARVLREEGGNKASAAKRLGVSRRSLYRWIARLDIKT